MLIKPPRKYPKRPSRAKSRAKSAPAPVLQQILSVQYQGDEIYFDVRVSAELASLVDSPLLIELSVDGSTWVGVHHAALDDDDHAHVFLEFVEDMSAATLWRVSAPADWVFVDGELGAPLSGEIA